MSESLQFTYTILRSDNNTVLPIPNLTHRNLVLSKIEFEADYWFFEAVLRSNAQDLAKLTSTYFQHHRELDLTKYMAKLEEGDKLELHVKPKASPKNINLQVTYFYQASEGAIIYQGPVRLTELKTSTLLSDICQQNRPTKLLVKADDPLLNLSLEPKFKSTTKGSSYPSWSVDLSSKSAKSYTLDFNTKELTSIVPLLKYYELDARVSTDKEMDAQLYFLAYGFKC